MLKSGQNKESQIVFSFFKIKIFFIIFFISVHLPPYCLLLIAYSYSYYYLLIIFIIACVHLIAKLLNKYCYFALLQSKLQSELLQSKLL